MSDVERLEAELKLAKALVPLEAAREAMHAKRTKASIAAYKKACVKATKLRQEWRLKHRTIPDGPGDGTATPDTVAAKAGVNPV